MDLDVRCPQKAVKLNHSLVSSVEFGGTHLRPISEEVLKISIRKMSLKNDFMISPGPVS